MKITSKTFINSTDNVYMLKWKRHIHSHYKGWTMEAWTFNPPSDRYATKEYNINL